MAAVSSLVDSNSLTNSLLYLQNALKSVYLLVYLLKFEDKHQKFNNHFSIFQKSLLPTCRGLETFQSKKLHVVCS